jgi:hypothetical protein
MESRKSNKALICGLAAIMVLACGLWALGMRFSRGRAGSSMADLKLRLVGAGLSVSDYAPRPGEAELAGNGDISRLMGLEDGDALETAEFCLDGVRVYAARFNNPSLAASAGESLRRNRGKADPHTEFLWGGPFVLRVDYWRRKLSGGRVIGLEEIHVKEEMVEKLKRALESWQGR